MGYKKEQGKGENSQVGFRFLFSLFPLNEESIKDNAL